MASLDGARLKHERAVRHLGELTEAAKAYLATAPFELTREEKASGDLVWRVRIRSEVPAIWSVVIGDIVHNLRSALDLLAWQLVAAGGGKPGRQTFFPVASDAAGLQRSLPRALDGATESAKRFVARLRPYPSGNSLLTRLHALNIADKHRLLLIVGAAHSQLILKMRMDVPWQDEPVEAPPIALRPADRQFPLEDGAEIFRIRASARDGEGAQTEHDIGFELAFGDVEEVAGLPLLETLEGIRAHVSRILEIADRRLIA